MTLRLKTVIFSAFVFAAILAGTSWATYHQSIFPVMGSLVNEPTGGNNPWLWACLVDAYLGFLWFWVWILLREQRLTAALAWIPALLLTGNFAMAVYAMLAAKNLPPDGTIADLLVGPKLRQSFSPLAPSSPAPPSPSDQL